MTLEYDVSIYSEPVNGLPFGCLLDQWHSITPDGRKAILGVLIKLCSGNVKDKDVGLCFYVLGALSRFEVTEEVHFYIMLKRLWCLWPKWSGSNSYPIPGTGPNDKSLYTGKAGGLRKELALFLLTHFKNIDKLKPNIK